MRNSLNAILAGLSVVLVANLQSGETIPYPPGIELGGAAAYLGTVDHPDSPYYMHPDFYNLRNTSSRTILRHFKTYQQTTEYTCGPAALVMAAYYRGVCLNELEVAAGAGSTEELGTSTEQMVNYLTATGWTVRSSLTEPKLGSLKFIKRQIAKGNPVMVEWVDWAGHWEVVIGYDDMGTSDDPSDDVLIMADPYDTSDHLQDGYGIVQADRFQYMWFDHNLLPENQRERQWIIFDR
jgi:hypothetical protein